MDPVGLLLTSILKELQNRYTEEGKKFTWTYVSVLNFEGSLQTRVNRKRKKNVYRSSIHSPLTANKRGKGPEETKDPYVFQNPSVNIKILIRPQNCNKLEIFIRY